MNPFATNINLCITVISPPTILDTGKGQGPGVSVPGEPDDLRPYPGVQNPRERAH